jgi:hypothetical protein
MTVLPKCWICGGTATTGEHGIKKSDLRAMFGKPTQKTPLFWHSHKRSNVKVGSLDATVLKLPSRLCAKCNNELTQPYDKAWSTFSAHVLDRNPPLKAGDVVRADRVFRIGSNRAMRDVQLYFAKLFGCYIDEGGMPIDLATFAQAIRDRTYHPELYLKFGVFKDAIVASGIGMTASINDKTGVAQCAGWFYQLGEFAVCPIYASNAEPKWENVRGAWHPQSGTGKILIHDFEAEVHEDKTPTV